MVTRDIVDAGRNGQTLGRIAFVACRLAMLGRVVDQDAQAQAEGLETTHDLRIGQIVGEHVDNHGRVGLAFVEKTEEETPGFKAKPRIGLSIALERRRIKVELRFTHGRHDLALVRKVTLVSLRTGEASREADIETGSAPGTMNINGCPRRGPRDRWIVAIPEHRRSLVGHRTVERNAGNMGPAKHLDW